MTTWLRNLLKRTSRKASTRRPARPGLETLEERWTPAVTNHGGALLSNVHAQALYYGSDWGTSSTYSAQANQLDGFLKYTVQSPYMYMLNKAGYGSADPGQTFWGSINKSAFLEDSTIRANLQSWISAGAVGAPDANRLYVVFVEDNVAVQNDSSWDSSASRYDNSIQDFLGYHGAFAGRDALGRAADIHYAVIAYPRGGVGNAGLSWLSDFNSMTVTASHELAEAVTDPNINYRALTWYDDTNNGEVGDLCNASTVYLGGYAVQRIVDKNDQAMTPWSVGPARPVNFVLMNTGYLWESTSSGWILVASNVTSVSDQGIDNHGVAMADYLTTSGNAYEYHDGASSSVFLWGNAVQAKAGQGVSYVLFSNGTLDEYHDATSTWTYVCNGSIQSKDAGTDWYGVNCVDMVLSGGNSWMHSDTDGWHFLTWDTRQLSAGQQGLTALVDTSGNAYYYSEGSNSFTYLTSGVNKVTTGYDAWGHWTVGVITYNAAAYLYTPESNSWTYLAGGVAQMSKEQLGVLDMVFGGSDASSFGLSGRHTLVSSGAVAVA